jgi:hypothetical protein
MLGGTNRPDDEGRAARGSTAASAEAAGVSTLGADPGNAGSSTAGAGGASATRTGSGATSTTGGGGAATAIGVGVSASASAIADAVPVAAPGAATVGAAGGTGGRCVLIRRGGGSAGVAAFGGSAAGPGFFIPVPAVFFTARAAASEKMSPFGSSIPRCRASRSTNCRATISSSVLDALFSSMP